MLKANLRRPEHMAGRVQRDANAVMPDRLTVGERMQRDVAKAVTQNAGAVSVR
jgi:hypothetical protein